VQATGKHFVMDAKFALGDLLSLELHNYVDACSEIVDRAQKELIIEKALRKIEETWAALRLTFSPYQVFPPTILISVCVRSLLRTPSNKVVAFFLMRLSQSNICKNTESM
jgi:dynein heavy chain, axonemal